MASIWESYDQPTKGAIFANAGDHHEECELCNWDDVIPVYGLS